MFLEKDTLIRGKIFGVPKCGVIVRCRFTMCTNCGGLRSGNRREAQDVLRIVRSSRMVCETRRGDTRPQCEDGEHSRMQTLLARRREGVLECAPGKFVSESKSALLVTNHTDVQATIDVRFTRPGAFLQQPEFCFSGYDANEFCDLARRRGKPGRTRKHGIAHGNRYRAGNSGQHFGHEERIASCDAVQAFRWPSGPPCELRDCGL